ncbi:3-deoxy-manno-octulosonate cytidylyltransferase [Alteromonas sp. H39]|uniref:3-deoxy-manno-octulosonate cytidylyltransferase n=1 Tax=Alteromonas sp. H39 TaxID=3389876 RepID=UPI0039DFAF90
MPFTVVIPARYGSTRFPGKPLADIQGKPMIQHVVDRAAEAGADHIIVATDDDRIAEVASTFSDVCMTAQHHQSGTERIAEVISQRRIAADTVVVNVQGDEPFVPAENIRQVARNLTERPETLMATLATRVHDIAEVFNPNTVKVLTNASGNAIYFSRSAIPFDREKMMSGNKEADPSLYLRHIGLYAYRAGYVQQYVGYAPSALEQIESLEQLRAIWYGDVIHCDIAVKPPPVGIDTPDDLVTLNQTLAGV